MTDRISQHISYEEATVSAKAASLGIKNDLPDALVPTVKLTAEKVFEPVRRHFRGPIQILSFYRTPDVNRAVGGSSKSQHVEGKAIDMSGTKYGIDNSEIFEYILVNLDFDQLIWEFGNDDEPAWVHASYNEGKNRRQVLKAVKRGGKTVYLRM